MAAHIDEYRQIAGIVIAQPKACANGIFLSIWATLLRRFARRAERGTSDGSTTSSTVTTGEKLIRSGGGDTSKASEESPFGDGLGCWNEPDTWRDGVVELYPTKVPESDRLIEEGTDRAICPLLLHLRRPSDGGLGVNSSDEVIPTAAEDVYEAPHDIGV